MASSSADYSNEVDVVFHGVQYVLSLSSTGGNLLAIEVMQESTGDRWRGEFSSKYVEEITHKTGNFKKFEVFVKMLGSAFQNRSGSVFVDLLTYNDLESTCRLIAVCVCFMFVT